MVFWLHDGLQEEIDALKRSRSVRHIDSRRSLRDRWELNQSCQLGIPIIHTSVGTNIYQGTYRAYLLAYVI